MIGDEIEVSIVDIKGEQVRIGIKAPKRIAVHRKEIYDANQGENIEAAGVKAQDVNKLADLLKPQKKKD